MNANKRIRTDLAERRNVFRQVTELTTLIKPGPPVLTGLSSDRIRSRMTTVQDVEPAVTTHRPRGGAACARPATGRPSPAPDAHSDPAGCTASAHSRCARPQPG